MSDCLWVFLVPLFGPTLAVLYAISVLGFKTSWYEWGWNAMTPQILLRSLLVVVASGIAVGLCQADITGPEGFVPVGLVTLTLSVWCLYRTRQQDIVGPVPVFPNGCMVGKVVLVTGANSGIGRETVRQLAELGATVVLACRSKDKAREAMADIEQTLPTETTPLTASTAGIGPTTMGSSVDGEQQYEQNRDEPRNGRQQHRRRSNESQLLFLKLDLTDFASVRSSVRTFLDMNLPLDVLVNNAGVLRGAQTNTKDGMEMMMQANHLGHFLLTTLLLPKLQETNGTVVNVSSIMYKFAAQQNGFDFDDPHCSKGQRPYTMYGQSKLANILFTLELTNRYPGIRSYTVHPGIVRTNVVQNIPVPMQIGDKAFGFIISQLQKTPTQGAYSSVLAAISTTVAGTAGDNNPDGTLPPPSGSFFMDAQLKDIPEAFAKNETVRSLVVYRTSFAQQLSLTYR